MAEDSIDQGYQDIIKRALATSLAPNDPQTAKMNMMPSYERADPSGVVGIPRATAAQREEISNQPPPILPGHKYVPGEVVAKTTAPSREMFWSGISKLTDPQSESGTWARAGEGISGLAETGLGGLGTLVSGGIAGLVDTLPTAITGDQYDRNRLAQELNEMSMFAIPETSPELLATRVAREPIGGLGPSLRVEGELAKQRLAERGPTRFFEPEAVYSGIDPTKIAKGAANLRDKAISKTVDAIVPEVGKPVSGPVKISNSHKMAENPPPADYINAFRYHYNPPITGISGFSEKTRVDRLTKVPAKAGIGEPYLAEASRKPEGRPLFTQTTTNANARQQISQITPLLEEFPDAAMNPQEWVDMTAKAYGSEMGLIPPWGLINGVRTGKFVEELKKQTPGQIEQRRKGLNLSNEIGEAYWNGEFTPEQTGKIFAWGIFSRGVNPYSQEAMSLETFFSIEPHIKAAAAGAFDAKYFDDVYAPWADALITAGEGHPGAGVKSNLNSFGRDFLVKMSEPVSEGNPVSKMQFMHNLLADRTKTGREIRREFAKIGEGVGIDNKVMSFILLVTGRPDVMVLDRIQLANIFNDGRMGKFNVWDGLKVPRIKNPKTEEAIYFPLTEKGREAAKAKLEKLNKVIENKKDHWKYDPSALTGTSLADATYGARGLVVYESIEDALRGRLADMYKAAGRPAEDATIGGFHWDTWVIKSDQEASHGTLEAILRQTRGEASPLSGIRSTQGDYQTFAYGARFGIEPNIGKFIEYPDSAGNLYRFSLEDFSAFQKEMQSVKQGIAPSEFKVTETKGRPWYERPEINRQNLDRLIARYGERLDEQLPAAAGRDAVAGGTGSGISAREAGFLRRGQVARGIRFGAGGPKGGLPSSYRRATGSHRGDELARNPPQFGAEVKEVFVPNAETVQKASRHGISTPTIYELKPGKNSAEVFREAISRSAAGSKDGAAVTVYPVNPTEELAGYTQMRLFLSADGKSGVALKGNDIVSLFNDKTSPNRNAVHALLQTAIMEGGRKLDAFDTILTWLYSHSGMKAVSRTPWNETYKPKRWDKQHFKEFNNGEPDVVYMVYDPDRVDFYKPGEGRFFTDIPAEGRKKGRIGYEDAVKAQEKAVEALEKKLAKRQEKILWKPAKAYGGSIGDDFNFDFDEGDEIETALRLARQDGGEIPADYADPRWEEATRSGNYGLDIDELQSRAEVVKDLPPEYKDYFMNLPKDVARSEFSYLNDLYNANKEFTRQQALSPSIGGPEEPPPTESPTGISNYNPGFLETIESYIPGETRKQDFEKIVGTPVNVIDFLTGIPTVLGADYKTLRYGEIPTREEQASMAIDQALNLAGGAALKGASFLAKKAVPYAAKVAPYAAGAIGMLSSPSEAEAGPERWFSKLFRAAEDIPMEKMTNTQALAMLRKAAPAEEIKWTNLEKFLADSPVVNKQELLDYLKRNQVQTQDVILGGKPARRDAVVPSETAIAPYKERWDELVAQNRAINEVMLLPPSQRNADIDDLLAQRNDIQYEMDKIHNKAVDATIEEMGGLGRAPKYQSYSTPGGEGYQETLITLGGKTKPKVVNKGGMWHVVDKNGETLRSKSGRAMVYYDPNDAEISARSFHRFSGTYLSPHWDEPDVIGHIRTQMLTANPPGANRPLRLFNVDEVQSDWGKAGRNKGFVTAEDKANYPNMSKQYDALNAQRRSLETLVRYGDDAAPETQAAVVQLAELDRQMTEIADRMTFIRSGGVPAAPYVASTQNWTDLSIKKALDQAIDSGADYFTFTPGEVQAKRYSLRNQVDELHYDPDDRVLFARKNGKSVMEQDFVEPEELEKYIGKELAQKLLSQPTKPSKWFKTPRHTLAGQDLEVGGEGMIDYYNNIYKKRVEKVVKDLTGKKVQWEVLPAETSDGIVPRLGFRIDDDLREAKFPTFRRGGGVNRKFNNSEFVETALKISNNWV